MGVLSDEVCEASAEVMGVLSDEVREASAKVMFETYATTLNVNVETLINMIKTNMVPDCSIDMTKYKFP